MSYKTIRVPSIYGGSTAPGFNMEDLTSWDGIADRVAPTLQASLASTLLADPQPRLWSGGGLAGTPAKQISLKDMASTLDPFWAVLPAASNTGVRRGTALRANSTAKVSLIDKDDFPPNCADETSAMYFKHQQLHSQGDLRYTVEVCVPGDTVTRKLENRATRQGFTEELYIRGNITFPPQFGDTRKAGQVARKIKLSTTYGRFELPNFRNNQTASAMFNPAAINRVSSRPDSGKRDDLTHDQDGSCHGPLLYLALALFGPGSFPDIVSLRNSDVARQQAQYTVCVPFVGLVPDVVGFQIPTLTTPCVRFANETEDARQARVDALRVDYLSLFLVPAPTTLEAVFNGAAFLVHEAISRSLFSSTSGRDGVSWDLGQALEVPTMSLAAMVVISALLALDVACLLGLALYSALQPQWTWRLDAFTMVRIGAALSERFPLRVAYDLDQIRELDELPGWMGEALTTDGERGGEEDRGAQSHAGLSRWDREIELGGGGPLRNNVRYRCYNGDHQVPGPMSMHSIPETLERRSQPPTTD